MEGEGGGGFRRAGCGGNGAGNSFAGFWKLIGFFVGEGECLPPGTV